MSIWARRRSHFQLAICVPILYLEQKDLAYLADPSIRFTQYFREFVVGGDSSPPFRTNLKDHTKYRGFLSLGVLFVHRLSTNWAVLAIIRGGSSPPQRVNAAADARH